MLGIFCVIDQQPRIDEVPLFKIFSIRFLFKGQRAAYCGRHFRFPSTARHGTARLHSKANYVAAPQVNKVTHDSPTCHVHIALSTLHCFIVPSFIARKQQTCMHKSAVICSFKQTIALSTNLFILNPTRYLLEYNIFHSH